MKEIEGEFNLSDLDIDAELNISNLSELGDSNTEIESNEILENSSELNLGLTNEQVFEFYEYLKGNSSRPIFAEKFFADMESRIKESSQIVTMMGLSFTPKLLAIQQTLVDSLSNPEAMAYLSTEDKMNYLKVLSDMSNKLNKNAMDYSQTAKDITGLPLVYRELLDQLLMISGDKLDRLKLLPKLIDLDNDTWDRIIEISKL